MKEDYRTVTEKESDPPKLDSDDEEKEETEENDAVDDTTKENGEPRELNSSLKKDANRKTVAMLRIRCANLMAKLAKM